MATKPMARGTLRRRHVALYAAMLSLAPAAIQAAELDYTLGALVLRSDNIGLSQNNPVSDTVVSPELTFNLSQAGSTLQFLAEGALRYPHYLDDTFDSGLQGALTGTLDWNILPGRISFQATDSLSRQSVNVLGSFTPDNQQQVNVFRAGPTLHARFNGVTRAQLDLLYTNTYAERSTGFQGDRYSALAQLERRINSTDLLTLNASGLQTRYDSSGAFFDYTRNDVFVGYTSALASIDIALEAGYSRVRPDNYAGDSSSPLFRGNVQWRATPRSVLNVGIQYEFSDAAQNLLYRDPPIVIPGVQDPLNPGLQIGPQTFRQRRATLGYAFTGERLSVQVDPYYDRIRYLTANLQDQDITGLSLLLDWRLRPSLVLSLAAVRRDQKYRDIQRDDRSTLVSLALTRQFSRHWSGRASVRRTERDSSSALQSYTENAVMLSMTYRR